MREMIQTQRLILRRFSPNDWGAMQALSLACARQPFADCDQPFPTVEADVRAACAWLSQNDAFRAVMTSDENRLIGYVHADAPDVTGDVDVGHVFHPDAQGKGYEEEALLALADALFAQPDTSALVAHWCKDDQDKIAPLLAIGMTEVDTRQADKFVVREDGGRDMFFCCTLRLSRSDWQAREKRCLLCGVGGQGTILASRILAMAAMNKGLFARTAETIGMAQRGGSVVSHVRVGARVPSPMIAPGEADVLLAFEPGEAVRNLSFLRPGGLLIVCDRIVPAVHARTPYVGTEMVDWLRANVARCAVLPAANVVSACGSIKALNIALVGALAQSGAMGLSLEELTDAMLQRIPKKYLEMNLRALQVGATAMKEAGV